MLQHTVMIASMRESTTGECPNLPEARGGLRLENSRDLNTLVTRNGLFFVIADVRELIFHIYNQEGVPKASGDFPDVVRMTRQERGWEYSRSYPRQ